MKEENSNNLRQTLMATVWRNRESDMTLALKVLDQFARQHQGKLSLLDAVWDPDDDTVTFWIQCLAEQFRMRHVKEIILLNMSHKKVTKKGMFIYLQYFF
jgi:hypothetical protein